MLEKFRKYQAALLVLFGVFLMFSFVIAPPLNDYLAQQAMIQTGGYDAVVTWTDDAGQEFSFNETDLQREYRTHVLTVQFLQSLLQAAHQRHLPQTEEEQREAQQQGRTFKPLSPITFNRETGQFGRNDLGDQIVTFELPTIVANEAQLVQRLLFAREAERIGILVTDDSVTNYLKNIANLTVAADQVDEIRKQAREPLSRPQLYEQLKKELLAQQYQNLTVGWANTRPTPAEERGYFDRVNRQIKVAVVPFPVADYMAATEEPDDATVKKHFEDHKDRIQNPLDDEPGFKERRKISWAYVAADLAPFIADALPAARKAITDQEIEDRYENARLSQSSYNWHPPYVAPPEAAASDEQPPEPSSSETPTSSTSAADDAAPAEAATPQDSPPAAKPAETPASEDAKPAPEPEKEADQGQADPKQASDGAAGSTPTRFVALQDAEAAAPETKQDAAPPAAETPAQDPAAPDQDNPPAGDAAAPVSDPEATDAPPAADAAAVPVPPLDVKPETQPATPTEPKLTRVLDDDLREQIRNELADNKAREQGQTTLREKLETILPQLRSYQRERNRWRVHVERLLKQATGDPDAETSDRTADENAKSDQILRQELDGAWDKLLAKIDVPDDASDKVIPVEALAKEKLGALKRWAKKDGDPQSLSRNDLSQPAPPDPAQLATNAHAFLRGGKLALVSDLEFAENDELQDLTRRFEDLIQPMQQMNAQVQQAQQILSQTIAEKGADSPEALGARNQLQRMQSQSQTFQQQLFSLMQQPFSQFAYAQNLLPYTTVRLQKNNPGGESVEYLVWKTDEQAERTPDLSDPGVKTKVAESLRQIAARDLAEQAANELQQQVTTSNDQSLAIDYLVPQATESDPSQNVTPTKKYPSLAALDDRAEVTTNFFSWLQASPSSFGMPGSAPAAPTISTLMVVKPAGQTPAPAPEAPASETPAPEAPASETPAPEAPAPEADAKGDCVTQPPADDKPAVDQTVEPAAETAPGDQETDDSKTDAEPTAAESAETAAAAQVTEAAGGAETTSEAAAELTMPALPRTLEKIGTKFMQPVFSANPGGLTIAWNEPKTVCYLVQITAQQVPKEALHKQFVEKRQLDQQIAQIHRQEVMQTAQGLFEEFEQKRNIKWPGRADSGLSPYRQ